MPTRMFVLKVINKERKILTSHEIIDLIAEQIVLVITRVCKESMSLFKFSYFFFVDV